MYAAALLAASAVLAAAGCSSDDDACVQVDPSCTPLYEPTFTNVFERTLVPTCGVEGSACHSADGAQNGLIFEDVDEAYRLLVDDGRVIPFDPSCSELGRRIATTDPRQVMPPGGRLAAAERCAILTWMANGAQR